MTRHRLRSERIDPRYRIDPALEIPLGCAIHENRVE
jgi:hypothetical protein